MENKISNYFRNKKEIVSVYLFGSYASGKCKKTSDVDIGILFEDNIIDSVENLKENYMMDLGRILRKDIEIVVMNHAGEMILNQIYKKGKPILINNAKRAKDFRIKSFALYFDFEYYLRKIQKSFIKNVIEN